MQLNISLLPFSLLPLSLLLTLTTAQTTSYSPWASPTAWTAAPSATASDDSVSICAAKPVVDACLGTTQAIADSCAATDYNCLCAKWSEVVVCFDNCPNDSRLTTKQTNKQTYCSNASIYTSATSSVFSWSPSSSATTTATDASQTSDGAVAFKVTGSSASVTGASASETAKTGAGTRLVVGAGSLLMGVAGCVVVFL